MSYIYFDSCSKCSRVGLASGKSSHFCMPGVVFQPIPNTTCEPGLTEEELQKAEFITMTRQELEEQQNPTSFFPSCQQQANQTTIDKILNDPDLLKQLLGKIDIMELREELLNRGFKEVILK